MVRVVGVACIGTVNRTNIQPRRAGRTSSAETLGARGCGSRPPTTGSSGPGPRVTGSSWRKLEPADLLAVSPRSGQSAAQGDGGPRRRVDLAGQRCTPRSPAPERGNICRIERLFCHYIAARWAPRLRTRSRTWSRTCRRDRSGAVTSACWHCSAWVFLKGCNEAVGIRAGILRERLLLVLLARSAQEHRHRARRRRRPRTQRSSTAHVRRLHVTKENSDGRSRPWSTPTTPPATLTCGERLGVCVGLDNSARGSEP